MPLYPFTWERGRTQRVRGEGWRSAARPSKGRASVKSPVNGAGQTPAYGRYISLLAKHPKKPYEYSCSVEWRCKPNQLPNRNESSVSQNQGLHQ